MLISRARGQVRNAMYWLVIYNVPFEALSPSGGTQAQLVYIA